MLVALCLYNAGIIIQKLGGIVINILQKILFIPDYLIGYGMGDPERNGEYRFLKSYLTPSVFVLDVGANIGEYAEKVIDFESTAIVHCFEPVNDTFKSLISNSKLTKKADQIEFNHFGLSDECGEAEIYIYGKLGGSNSIVYNEYHASLATELVVETIRLKKLDDYLAEIGVASVDFLKIDVEGLEARVLAGAINSIKSGVFGAIQFEYGGQWKNSGASLVDLLFSLKNSGYLIFRLTPWGKLPIKRIGPGLENYKHCNYIAIKDRE